MGLQHYDKDSISNPGAEMNFLAIDIEQPFGKDKIRSISHTMHKNKLSVNQASKLKKKMKLYKYQKKLQVNSSLTWVYIKNF